MSDSAEAASPSDLSAPGQHHTGSLWKLTLGSVGVVYGDIGTSPIYAMRESLHAASRDGLTRSDVIGVISLLIWALILIVTIKYVALILRAENRGEGGTLSLVALVQQALSRRPAWLLGLGMVGIALFFGDAMITPAISVLSAVEGLSLITPTFERFVIPITLVIIAALFFVQRWGTGAVSAFFGPITVVWFLTMAVLGLMHIGDDIRILKALNPGYAAGFLVQNGLASLIVLGSVFLAQYGGGDLPPHVRWEPSTESCVCRSRLPPWSSIRAGWQGAGRARVFAIQPEAAPSAGEWANPGTVRPVTPDEGAPTLG